MSTPLHNVTIIVPGLELFAGDRENPRLVRRSTHAIRDTIRGRRPLPVEANEIRVGEALGMDFVVVDGVESLLFHARLTRPPFAFLRRADGALIGGLNASGWLSGIFPTAVRVHLVKFD